MNSKNEQELTFLEEQLSLVDKLKIRRERYNWALHNTYECHVFDGCMVWDKSNHKLKRLMKNAGFETVSKYVIAFIFADYLLKEHHLITPGKTIGEIYYSNSVARNFSNYLRNEYGIKVGTIGLNLPVYEKAPKQAKQSLHSAYHALGLLQQAINQNRRLVSFTLLLPTELVEKPLRTENPNNARSSIIRKVTEPMGELKGSMLASLELGDIDRLHNPHLHGLLLIPGSYNSEVEYQGAERQARDIMISAVGKTVNARHQLQFRDFYSQGWITYIGKEREKVSRLLGGSAYYCPNDVRSSGGEFYEQVRVEMLFQERVVAALLSDTPA